MDRDRTEAPPAAGSAPGAAGAGSLPGRDPDRQCPRHQPPRARHPRRRRPDRGRGHPAHPQPARDPRPPPRGAAARALPRPQWRGAAAAAARGVGRGPLGGAGLRCGHAAGCRPRLPSRGRGDRGRPRRAGGPRRLGAAGGAVGRRPAERSVPVRGLSRAAAGGAAPDAHGARGGAGDAGLLRVAAAAGGEPRRHGGGARRPTRRGLPRADQAFRGDPPRRRSGARRRLRGRRRAERRDRRRGRAARRSRAGGRRRGRGAGGGAGRLSVKDAAAEVAAALGMPRRQAYARALELSRVNHEGKSDSGSEAAG